MLLKRDAKGKSDWTRALLAWMHDPVDKALDVQGHEDRAARYASLALGRTVAKEALRQAVGVGDNLAEKADRLPMPARTGLGEDGPLTVFHPLSGAASTLHPYRLPEVEDTVTKVIKCITDGMSADPHVRYLALWRLLPEELAAALRPDFVRLPADTRIPDHTLIQHADIATGIAVASRDQKGYAYLSLSIGPVQTFIEAARSVRDLWSGSAILSWLAFQGMLPILEQLGPTALVFPALRGSPLIDLWLRQKLDIRQVPLPTTEARLAPSLPNRFLALVPYGPNGKDATCLADACEKSIKSGWQAIASDVHALVNGTMRPLHNEWDKRWADQINDFFDVSTNILPFGMLSDDDLAYLAGGKARFEEVWPDAAAVRLMAEAVPEKDRPPNPQAGRWQAHMELSARMMEARRTVQHIPAMHPAPDSPPKCSQLGTYEQLGPADLRESAQFWKMVQNSNPRFRDRERFCAVATAKRFAADTTLRQELHLQKDDLRFPDTASVAAANWLNDSGLDYRSRQYRWSGHWLHPHESEYDTGNEQHPSQDIQQAIQQARIECGEPPTYYAVLMMDADHMGQWLGGQRAPRVGQVLHPAMAAYFEQHAPAVLNVRRPLGPALNGALSEALNNFASRTAPAYVRQYNGTVIYAGGDDLLALLPIRQVMECAHALQRAFRGLDGSDPGVTDIKGRQHVAMGETATLSAGIAFVHYRHDLRLALGLAREAEKQSKSHGRNRITLRFARRTGEQSVAELQWEQVPWLQSLIDAFSDGATSRWAYELRRVTPTLEGEEVPSAAIGAEVRRLIARSQQFSTDSQAALPDEAVNWWDQYCDHVDHATLSGFTNLCLGAAFLARGTDK